MEWLLILLLVLALITLIGHGIWVLLAWVFRGGKRLARPTPGPSAPIGRDTELAIAARQVQQFLAEGSVSAETCQEVLTAIEWRRAAQSGRELPRFP